MRTPTSPRLVYRVLQASAPPRLEDQLADAFRYGARILYVDGPPPAEPIRVPGTVIHSTLVETAYFLGTDNPLLEHLAALQRIENDKLFEAELVSAVAPEAVARTELVGRIWRNPTDLAPEAYLSWLERQMHARYPRGFVLKPLSSFSTDGKFPSHRTPFVALWRAFKAEAEPEIARCAGMDPTDLHHKLKAMPSYPGRILDALITAPDSVLIQEWLDIASHDGVIEEYRVHVVGGRVLRGATQHRWGHYRAIEVFRIRQVEAFVGGIIGKLPAPYNVLTYGVDVVGLTDGTLAFMEGNAGWESQYFYAEFDIWVANLLAEHYAGRPTPLLTQFRRFAAIPGMSAKIVELRKLLTHHALADAIRQSEPITEVLAQARLVLLDELRRSSSRDALELVIGATDEFKLEPYFSHGELRELDDFALARAA